MGRPKGSSNGTKATAKAQTDDVLKKALEQIEKDFGKGSVTRLGDSPNRPEIRTISTGSFSLDLALGVGGLPRGRVVEIYGPESAGKTTICLQLVAEAQAQGELAAIIDTEHAIDLKYAEALGVDVENLYFSQPDYGEQALEIVDRLAKTGKFAVIVVDSVAALVPKKELEGEMGDSSIGLHSRLMSQAMRKLTGTVSKADCIVIFTNQLREKIGVMFGSPETTTGGNALKFYASVRMDIRRVTAIKKGDEDPTGNQVRVRVVKNKVAPPHRLAEFDIVFGKGTDYEKEIIIAAVEANIVQKSGSWFAYGEIKIGQGLENTIGFLLDNPELYEEIETKTKAFYYGNEPQLVQNNPEGALEPEESDNATVFG